MCGGVEFQATLKHLGVHQIGVIHNNNNNNNNNNNALATVYMGRYLIFSSYRHCNRYQHYTNQHTSHKTYIITSIHYALY